MNKEEIKQQIIRAHEFRHATRVYKEQKISDDDIQFILETARLSPSSIGLEPWRFIILDNQEVKDKIKEVGWGAVKQLETASHFVLIVAKKGARYDSELLYNHFKARQPDPLKLQKMIDVYEKFQVNDIEIADSERALFDWTSKQTYIALGNMMTAAAQIGIDSCPIEGFDYQKVNEILADYQIIDAEHEGISVMVSFGYREHDPKRPKTRQSFDEVVSVYK